MAAPRSEAEADAPVDRLFLERWSPRAFDSERPTRDQVLPLFEAARWAPSIEDAEPVRFVFAYEPEDVASFLELLGQHAIAWARTAPVLAYVLVHTHFSDGRSNDFASFDAGAAYMSLALQAHMLGLTSRATADFDTERARELLKVPHGCKPVVAVAIGRAGDRHVLAPELQQREHPTSRLPLARIAFERVVPPHDRHVSLK
jgi:nitroreductase